MVEPGISIVVPVLYEQDTIAGLLRHLRQIDGENDSVEIIVVDGDPRGGTIRRIEDDGVVTMTSKPWRSRQMNAGAAVARGDILLFLHADTLLPRNALIEITDALREERYVGGAFRMRFDSDRPVYRFMSAFVTLRSRWNGLPYGDQSIFIRRDYFERSGGYREIPVMEDVELVGRIRRAGGRLKILDATVQTSRRRMEAEGVARRALLNWMMTILYRFGVSPEKLVRFYTEDYRLRED